MNQERLLQVILSPHVSEKAARAAEGDNAYAFKVSKDASKPDIRAAVEMLFEVSVVDVRTVNVKGKSKRTARGMSRRKDWKKAYVRVADGQSIDFAPVE